jgi:lipid II:glycine glycyltransferase (peptidoglycan interpeptide bridge formation enzyme)
MECSFSWNRLDLEEWRKKYGLLRRANLLQSYDYARTICDLNQQKARWGLIKIDDQEAGMFQILEAGILWDALHAIILDRGPLWFEGYGTPEQQAAFFKTFAKTFPRRPGRKRRIIPELNDNREARHTLENLGYKRLPAPGYKTIWVDLRREEDDIRTSLKSSWRNKLGKAEKSGLIVEWDEKAEHFPWLLRVYQEDMVNKGYDGPSVPLLKVMGKSFSGDRADKCMLIGRAVLDGEAVAAVLIFLHGKSATYQVGWSSQKGRNSAAHTLLLWQGMLYLKGEGIEDFDLGGVNDGTAKGVKQFKEGINGETITLVGQYF